MNLERAVLEDGAVREAVALCRRDVRGEYRVVVYVVTADGASVSALRDGVARRLPSSERLPHAYVAVSAIPLDAEGAVDREALERFEVIDDDLIEGWRRVLAGTDGFDDAVVAAVDQNPTHEVLHRSVLVPKRSADARLAPPAQSRPSVASEALARSRFPAVADGGALIKARGAPETLGRALEATAETHASSRLVHVGADGAEVAQSYAQLLAEAEKLSASLSALGLRPGDKIIFQLAQSREFLTAFWACMLGGWVPALVSIPPRYSRSHAAMQRLLSAWELLDRPLILADRRFVTDLRAELGREGAERVLSFGALPPGGSPPRHASGPDDLAVMLFTSGSTGVPKGVMQSHRSLLAMAMGTAQQNGFSSADLTLNWMPLDHVGAISFLHVLPTLLGCSQVHVPTDYIVHDPLRWLELMSRHAATISWGPNFAFKLLNERSADIEQRSWNLSPMRFLVTAGEMVSTGTMQRSLELLARHGLSPRSVRPAFGMSETCSGITWSAGFESAEARFVDLGAPIPSASLRIVDAAGRVVEEGEIGRLQLKGASVMSGYYKNPEADAKAFTADGWFDTGDLGFLRNGRLTLTGREKDEIIINGINYVAAEIEAAVDAVNGVDVSFSAACAVRSPGSDAEELAVFFVPEPLREPDLAAVLRSIRAQVAGEIGISASYVVPLRRDEVPKTSIGKIQRSELRRRFEAGELEDRIQSADVLTGTNVVPQWFYRKEWRRKAVRGRRTLDEVGPVLVLADSGGLGAAIAARLDAHAACVVVEAGEDFRKLGHGRYRLDPGCAAHYSALLAAIAAETGEIATIVHCASCDDGRVWPASIEELGRAQRRGLYSVLHLVQALAARRPEARSGQREAHGVELYMSGRGTQIAADADDGPCVHAAAVGLLKTIPEELRWLACRHVDLDPEGASRDAKLDSEAASRDADVVLDELRCPGGEDEVAYRAGKRLVAALTRADLAKTAAPRDPIVRGGVYLVTGGLGGIGAFLAGRLMRDYGVRAILVGSTPLPPRQDWPQHLERGGKAGERIHRYLELEALGAEFIYEPADVADVARLRGIVEGAEARWGAKLSGVFHLAASGEIASRWENMERFSVRAETEASFESALHAKVYGAWAVYTLARERPGCAVVPFGSVLGLFGAARFASYCAAHTFLHNFGLAQRRRFGIPSSSFSWAVWDEIGLSRGDPAFAKDLYESLGYRLIAKDLGYECLLAGLCRDEAQLVVGLDGGKPNVYRRVIADARPLREVAAFCKRVGDSRGEGRLPEGRPMDLFGTPSRCDVAWVDAWPLRADGTVDRAALAAQRWPGEPGREQHAEPQGETQKRLASIWCEILSLDRIGATQSFFALGGNSLGATRLVARIREEFQVAMDIRELFGHATIAALADLLEQKLAATAGHEPSDVDLDDASALLARVEQMSDGEVAKLLARIAAGGTAR
jgi:acyl-CoA synthetase (AMP-forming)/AMP-acid ligase II/NAD(P)-dependent dehydrogenase (short-subunit alcohol dehydrogenase family)/acyl carrier protein